jgi:hypothetical protein
MRDRNGDPVAPEDALDQEELGAYYRSHRRPVFTGFEHLSLGPDPAVAAWEQAMADANTNDEHIERGTE